MIDVNHVALHEQPCQTPLAFSKFIMQMMAQANVESYAKMKAVSNEKGIIVGCVGGLDI